MSTLAPSRRSVTKSTARSLRPRRFSIPQPRRKASVGNGDRPSMIRSRSCRGFRGQPTSSSRHSGRPPTAQPQPLSLEISSYHRDGPSWSRRRSPNRWSWERRCSPGKMAAKLDGRFRAHFPSSNSSNQSLCARSVARIRWRMRSSEPARSSTI